MNDETLLYQYSAALLNLTSPKDMEIAGDIYKANCGPASFAALFGQDVVPLMTFFPQFPKRPRTNVRQMQQALVNAGARHERSERRMAQCGLSLIQFEGPWGGVESWHPKALRRTHWVANKAEMIYDVNWGSWLSLPAWKAIVLKMFLDYEPRIRAWQPKIALECQLPTQMSKDSCRGSTWISRRGVEPASTARSLS